MKIQSRVRRSGVNAEFREGAALPRMVRKGLSEEATLQESHE